MSADRGPGAGAHRGTEPDTKADTGANTQHGPRHHPRHGLALLIAGGLVVGVASGMFGVGGPLLTVPLLVAIGTPILPALAAAQVQSVIISGVGTVGYLSQSAIDWPLALIVGIPELLGVVIGWRIARRVPTRHLKRILIITLVAVAPLLVLYA